MNRPPVKTLSFLADSKNVNWMICDISSRSDACREGLVSGCSVDALATLSATAVREVVAVFPVSSSFLLKLTD